MTVNAQQGPGLRHGVWRAWTAIVLAVASGALSPPRRRLHGERQSGAGPRVLWPW